MEFEDAYELDFTEIIPERLWIGASPSRNDLIELKRQNNSELVIMDLTSSPGERSWCRELGIAYDERTPMRDETGNSAKPSQGSFWRNRRQCRFGEESSSSLH